MTIELELREPIALVETSDEVVKSLVKLVESEPVDDLPPSLISVRDDAESAIESGIYRDAAYLSAVIKHFGDDADNVWADVVRARQGTIEYDITKREVRCIAEAVLDQHNPEWIVDSFIGKGQLVMMYGKAGIGKTYTLLSLGLAVSRGGDWLGRSTSQTPVLLVDEENGINRLYTRAKEIWTGMGYGPASPVYNLIIPRYNFSNKDDRDHLLETIQRTGAGLAMVDSLIDVIPGIDENSATDMQPVLQELRDIAVKSNCTIMFSHHSNKGDGYRGSSTIEGTVDLMVKMESKPGDTLLMCTEKARDYEKFCISAKQYHSEGSYRLSLLDEMVPASSSVSLSQTEHRVLQCLSTFEIATHHQVSEKLDDLNVDQVRSTVTSLKNKDLATRADGGARGSTAYYKVTEEGLKYLNK